VVDHVLDGRLDDDTEVVAPDVGAAATWSATARSTGWRLIVRSPNRTALRPSPNVAASPPSVSWKSHVAPTSATVRTGWSMPVGVGSAVVGRR
jgi:hypothetical protein